MNETVGDLKTGEKFWLVGSTAEFLTLVSDPKKFKVSPKFAPAMNLNTYELVKVKKSVSIERVPLTSTLTIH